MVAHFSPEILENDKTGEISVTAQLCHQSGDYIKASGQALMALSLVLAGLRAAPPPPPTPPPRPVQTSLQLQSQSTLEPKQA